MSFYTYAHIRCDTGLVFYIGKGAGRRAWSRQNRNKWWRNIVAKHGYEVQILAAWQDEDSAFEHEKLLISCFRDLQYALANISHGGTGPTGYKHSDAMLEKMSQISRQKMQCSKLRKRISERLRGVSKGRPGKLSLAEIERRTQSRYLVTPRFAYDGKSLTIKEWSELLGLPNSTIRYRFQVGASPYEKRNKRGESKLTLTP